MVLQHHPGCTVLTTADAWDQDGPVAQGIDVPSSAFRVVIVSASATLPMNTYFVVYSHRGVHCG